jgi:zinc protease
MAKNGKTMHSLPGTDDIYRRVLSNGIVILARPNFNSAAVTVSGYFTLGALAETEDKLGLADFVASALMRGTEKYSFDAIYNQLESVGATLGYDSGTHTTSFGGRSLAEDLPLLLRLFSDTLRTPTFPQEEVERLRAQLMTGLAMRAQDTADMADLTFDQIMYPGHPYSQPGDGWPETIQAITRDDMVAFHESFCGPRGLVIAIVGGIEPKKAADAVERVLGRWKVESQQNLPPLPPLIPNKKVVRRQIKIAGKSQSDIVVGSVGLQRTSPEYMAASLGNSILGQFGMMGRIGNEVREKSGLAYYAYSSLSAGVGPGAWTVSAGVNPSNVRKAVDLIEKELVRFAKHGVSEDELADSQANFIGRLPLSLESNGGVANALLTMERYGLGLEYYRDYEDMVRRVTTEDVLATARKYIDPKCLGIAIAGP